MDRQTDIRTDGRTDKRVSHLVHGCDGDQHSTDDAHGIAPFTSDHGVNGDEVFLGESKACTKFIPDTDSSW